MIKGFPSAAIAGERVSGQEPTPLLSRRRLLAGAPSVLIAADRAEAKPDFPALQDYERQTGGRVGLYAQNLRTGMSLSWRARERFVMCSTFKASLAACVLARVDRGFDRLDARVAYGPRDLLEYAPVAKAHLKDGALSVEAMSRAVIELSDNACANLLLARIGGPKSLTAFWRSIGDLTSNLDHTEPALNRSPPGDPHDTTTPAAMTATLHRLVFGDVLSAGSKHRLRTWLVGCQTGAKRIRAGLPRRWLIGDKTGNNGKDAFGDLAVVFSPSAHPLIVSVYVQGGTPTEPEVDKLFASIGPLITACL